MISRCNCLIDQLCSTNQIANQSSNSGCDGRAPMEPKLLGVATMPFPKCCCQIRLTMTRAVSVLSRLAIHLASAKRRPPVDSGTVFHAVDFSKSFVPAIALSNPGFTASSGDASDPPTKMWIAGTTPPRIVEMAYTGLTDWYPFSVPS